MYFASLTMLQMGIFLLKQAKHAHLGWVLLKNLDNLVKVTSLNMMVIQEDYFLNHDLHGDIKIGINIMTQKKLHYIIM